MSQTVYSYDAVGNRKTVTYPNGTETEYFYDDLNRLTRVENRKSDGTVFSAYEYELGDAGNRELLTEYADGAVVRTVDYAYDDLYRLTGETAYAADSSVERSVSYAYDDFGNRVSKTDASGTTGYHYDRNDRLEEETGPDYTFTYDYDDNGNTLSRSDGTDTVSYTWDAENRLVSADDGSTVTTYGYDADGIRVSAETDGEVTMYLVDKNRDYAQVLEERDGSGGLIVSYVYGDDLIRQKRGEAFSYYQYDGQLSTRQLTDETGNVTDTYTYDAFGDVLSQSGITENSYLYTGEQFDPNAGFYYLRARYYDPAVGRFLSSDPYAGRQFEPVTLHKYLYANANPLMYSDPSGKVGIWQFCVAISNQLLRNVQTIPVGYGLLNTVRTIIPNSRILGNNLIAAGFSRMATGHAHHIVAGTATVAEPARSILFRYGIGINEFVNGVFLPSYRHYPIHSALYYRTVNRMLMHATSREDVVSILGQITTMIQSGTFPY